VAECLAANGIALPLLQLGLPDQFVEHGDPARLLALCGLDAEGIVRAIRQRFGSRLTVVRPAVAR
jgi:1-deoxy-D-xylulose-5-phosphate synthase